MQIFIYFFLCFGDRVVPPSIDRFWRPLLGLYINIDTVVHRAQSCLCLCLSSSIWWMDGARFNVPLDTKYVILETFFSANLLAGRKYFTVFTKFLCMLLMPWLGPPLSALQYVMYFRLYLWRHICTGHMDRHTDTVPTGDVIASSCTG